MDLRKWKVAGKNVIAKDIKATNVGHVPLLKTLLGIETTSALLASSLVGGMSKWHWNEPDGIEDFGGKKSCSILRPDLVDPAMRALPIDDYYDGYKEFTSSTSDCTLPGPRDAERLFNGNVAASREAVQALLI